MPSELLVLPAELARVDTLLDDPVFFAPFADAMPGGGRFDFLAAVLPDSRWILECRIRPR